MDLSVSQFLLTAGPDVAFGDSAAFSSTVDITPRGSQSYVGTTKHYDLKFYASLNPTSIEESVEISSVIADDASMSVAVNADAQHTYTGTLTLERTTLGHVCGTEQAFILAVAFDLEDPSKDPNLINNIRPFPVNFECYGGIL